METVEEKSALKGSGAVRQRITVGITIAIALAGVVLVALDWGRFAPVLRQADGRPLLPALALTALSYVCVGLAFALVSRMLGIRMSRRDLAEIGFLSTILNHVLTTGGIAGYSVRYLLMQRRGVALKDVVAASVLHFYLTSLDMLSMLPVGFLYLLTNASLPRGVTALVGLMTLIMAIVAAAATALIFRAGLRIRLLNGVGRLGRAVLRRDFSEPLERFDSSLAQGVAAMRREPRVVLAVMALTWIDWFASVAVVWLCFDAFGPPIPFGDSLSSFVIGVSAGVLSMVPGGLGVQEGSMAGVFALLGASFQQALLASILFRVVFFLVPYGVSLPFYGRLLRK